MDEGRKHCWHDHGMSIAYTVHYPDGYVPREGHAKCCHCGKTTTWHTKAVCDPQHGPHVLQSRSVTVYDDESECVPVGV